MTDERNIDQGHGPVDTGECLSQLAERLVTPMDDLIDEAEADTDRLGHVGAHSDTSVLVGELAAILLWIFKRKGWF